MIVVGVCRIELELTDNFSLKGKRAVIKRVIQRTRNRFNVAMAEVEEQDVLTRAVLAFSVVGNERRFVNSCLDKVVDFIEQDAEVPVGDFHFSIEDYT